jgi:hypothetical protein
MFLYRGLAALIFLLLGALVFSIYNPAKAIEWECVRDANHVNAQGVKDGVDCKSAASGQFTTEPLCREGCNRLCARGFKPSCNFTSVCKVYGFAINLMSVGAGLAALMVLLYGAYRYVMGKGEAEAITTAQAIIINAGIGLILVVVAYSLTRVFLALLQVESICF